jgi:hypothetical protein
MALLMTIMIVVILFVGIGLAHRLTTIINIFEDMRNDLEEISYHVERIWNQGRKADAPQSSSSAE